MVCDMRFFMTKRKETNNGILSTDNNETTWGCSRKIQVRVCLTAYEEGYDLANDGPMHEFII